MKRFNDTTIKGLKPKLNKNKTKLIEHTVREGHGFAIRVLPSGAKTFLFIYNFEGKRKKLSCGNYVGKDKDRILGYAAIETSTVRTKPETLLIVLTPDGELRKVYTLAFHEPPEYQPPEHWFEQLYKRSLADMDFNKGVDGISGATLSTRSALNSIRKVMAIYQVMVKNKSAN